MVQTKEAQWSRWIEESQDVVTLRTTHRDNLELERQLAETPREQKQLDSKLATAKKRLADATAKHTTLELSVKQKRADAAEKARLAAEAEAELQRGIDLARAQTLLQSPVPITPVDWSYRPDVKNSPYSAARAAFAVVNDALDRNINRGERIDARWCSTLLYEIDKGGTLGVYTYGAIQACIEAGNLSPCVKEHVHGREKSSEAIHAWRRKNRNATFEEFCVFIEKYVWHAWSDADENQTLKRSQNHGEYGVHPDWPIIYHRAGSFYDPPKEPVRWLYIHFPPGKRTVEHLRWVADQFGIPYKLPKGLTSHPN